MRNMYCTRMPKVPCHGKVTPSHFRLIREKHERLTAYK